MKKLFIRILLASILAVPGKITLAANGPLVKPGVDSGKRNSTNDTSSITGSVIKPASPAASLSSFSAGYDHHAVTIKFSAEAVNPKFSPVEVEHSLDGVHFEKAGVAALLASDSRFYAYTDKVRPSTILNNDLYYRLKQTDEEGNAVYSKIRVLRAYESEMVVAISVATNPEVNNLVADIQLKQSAFVVMKITDTKGHMVIRKVVKAVTGTNSLEIEGSNHLQPGTYSLEIIVNSNERMNMTLIKI